DDRRVVLVRRDVGDERAVDLDLRYRQSFEVRERRVARAEIVDRETDAHRAQLGEHGYGPEWIRHDRALRELERERARHDVSFLEQLLNLPCEVVRAETSRGEIDGDAEIEARGLPALA